jgi:hypothetical protein
MFVAFFAAVQSGTKNDTRVSEKESGRLDRTAALNNADEYDNNGEYQEDVDEAAQRIRADYAKQPQNDQDSSNREEHLISFQGNRLTP